MRFLFRSGVTERTGGRSITAVCLVYIDGSFLSDAICCRGRGCSCSCRFGAPACGRGGRNSNAVGILFTVMPLGRSLVATTARASAASTRTRCASCRGVAMAISLSVTFLELGEFLVLLVLYGTPLFHVTWIQQR